MGLLRRLVVAVEKMADYKPEETDYSLIAEEMVSAQRAIKICNMRDSLRLLDIKKRAKQKMTKAQKDEHYMLKKFFAEGDK